ncbi:MAG TPA: hypothetical protein VIY47_14420 [Ignavibacteriaceae bacterium]
MMILAALGIKGHVTFFALNWMFQRMNFIKAEKFLISVSKKCVQPSPGSLAAETTNIAFHSAKMWPSCRSIAATITCQAVKPGIGKKAPHIFNQDAMTYFSRNVLLQEEKNLRKNRVIHLWSRKYSSISSTGIDMNLAVEIACKLWNNRGIIVRALTSSNFRYNVLYTLMQD